MTMKKTALLGIFTLAVSGGAIFANSLSDAKEAQNASPAPKTPAVEAKITSVLENGVFTARAHIWASQYVDTIVCTREPKPPCTEQATLLPGETAAAGNVVHLTNVSALAFDPAQTPPFPAVAHVRPRQDRLTGPVEATVTRLGDGDTLEVAARVWTRQIVITDIRIGGIDTPEKEGRAKCTQEATLAQKASDETARLLRNKSVLLTDIQFEKYGGRVLGKITTPEGIDAGKNLIDQNLARPYDGRKKSSWCQAPKKARPAK